MFLSLRTKMNSVPTPIAGLALGIASLGLCVESRFPFDGNIQIGSAVIAGLLLVLLIVKFSLNPKQFKIDLGHTYISSVMPTFSMALMVVSMSIGIYNLPLAIIVWYCAVLIQFFLLIGFIHYRIQTPDWSHVTPSWFVPTVGVIVAGITCPSLAQQPLALNIVLLGLCNGALVLIPMIYRFIFHPEIVDAAKPSIAILAAPANVGLVGYLTVTAEPSALLVAILLGIGLLMTSIVYMSLFRLLRLPFSPGFAAFTFPTVISATAVYKSAELFKLWGLPEWQLLSNIADLELVIASLLVVYVVCGYLKSAMHSFNNIPA
ncbi:TDT family transporter [Colwelliaceae bacterium BS250]